MPWKIGQEGNVVHLRSTHLFPIAATMGQLGEVDYNGIEFTTFNRSSSHTTRASGPTCFCRAARSASAPRAALSVSARGATLSSTQLVYKQSLMITTSACFGNWICWRNPRPSPHFKRISGFPWISQVGRIEHRLQTQVDGWEIGLNVLWGRMRWSMDSMMMMMVVRWEQYRQMQLYGWGTMTLLDGWR